VRNDPIGACTEVLLKRMLQIAHRGEIVSQCPAWTTGWVPLAGLHSTERGTLFLPRAGEDSGVRNDPIGACTEVLEGEVVTASYVEPPCTADSYFSPSRDDYSNGQGAWTWNWKTGGGGLRRAE
jgi:hypothetical protein